jgi:16S rRNA (cytosine967-C5)-methyltransferase
MTNSRFLALESLLEVLNGNVVLKRAVESRSPALDRRDRAFLMEIVYGVLRFRDTLDWILNHFLKNPSRLGDRTLNNLRIAVYQLLFMRVPEWAVVNEAVEMEKISSGSPAGPGLVNAVLRNLLRRRNSFSLPLAFDDPVLRISINSSHPSWLVKRWVARFGEEETALLAEANNEIPRMTLRVNTLKTGRKELLERLSLKGIAAEPTRFSPDGISLRDTVSYEDLSFVKGLFVVQDEASQLMTYLLNPGPGERILDACAAPGGKTTHIAQMTGDSGEIVAVEKDAKRIARLRDNIGALGITSVRIVNADIRDLQDAGSFDRVLLDAPCSATGVIRKNPDVKYRHTEGDLLAYKVKQTELLRTVSRLLKKDGTLVYSVCSTEPEEGEETVNEFLKAAPDFRMIDTEVTFLRDFIDGVVLRTYPHRHHMDGFFGASLCRKK